MDSSFLPKPPSVSDEERKRIKRELLEELIREMEHMMLEDSISKEEEKEEASEEAPESKEESEKEEAAPIKGLEISTAEGAIKTPEFEKKFGPEISIRPLKLKKREGQEEEEEEKEPDVLGEFLSKLPLHSLKKE